MLPLEAIIEKKNTSGKRVLASLRTVEYGEGSALLCLHGLGGGAWFFADLAVHLAAFRRVIVLDLPGTGENRAALSPFSISGCVDQIARVVASLPPRPVVLGHSLGTILALELNSVAPGAIGGFVFLGGLPRVRESIRERLKARLDRIRRRGMAELGAEAVPGVFSAQSIRDLPHQVARFSHNLEACPPDVYTQVCQALLDADATGAVSGISAPSLVLTGSDDSYAPPDEARAFARGLTCPKEYGTLDACGHLAFLEAPAQLAGRIRAFLRLYIDSGD